MSKPIVRSSSLPMLMTCTPSILNPDNLILVEAEVESALLGTLIHGKCQALVDTGAFDLADLKQRLNDADYERANVLLRNFLNVWGEASKLLKHPQTELGFSIEMAHCTLTGHIDVFDIESGKRKKEAYVLDYKTGRQHEDHYHQVAAYAFGVWDKAGRPAPFTVHVSTVYLEDKAISALALSVDDLLAWERELDAKLLDLRYTAGRKCAFCRLQGACPAYRTYTSGAIRVFNDDLTVPAQVWDAMTPEERGSLIDKMYVVEKAIDRVKLSLRNMVKAKGAVDIGTGKEYVLVEQEEKRLDPAKALKLLEKRIGKAGIVRASRLPLDDVLGEFAKSAARGKKTEARKELYEELDKAGAIIRSTTTKMFRRPKSEKVLG